MLYRDFIPHHQISQKGEREEMCQVSIGARIFAVVKTRRAENQILAR